MTPGDRSGEQRPGQPGPPGWAGLRRTDLARGRAAESESATSQDEADDYALSQSDDYAQPAAGPAAPAAPAATAAPPTRRFRLPTRWVAWKCKK